VEKSNLQISTFGLAKGLELVSDDTFEVKSFDNLTVAVLCDGVGSAKEAKKASSRVVKHLINNFKLKPEAWTISEALEKFIESINNILYTESVQQYEKPEYITTLTIVVIHGNRIYGANLGDSRIYLLRDGHLSQLSIDHSMNDGKRDFLTKAVGLNPEESPYLFENNIQKDDYLLLCSDGLYNELNDIELIEKIPLMATGIVKYVNTKLHENLIDDTSAIVIRVLEDSEIEKRKAEKLPILEELKTGDEVDGFILKKSLIQNNRTWLAENRGKNYILKFPTIEAIESEEHLNFFVREAWNGRRIKSKIFPRAVIPKNRTSRYYLMEAINGEDITNKKLSVDESIQLLKTLLSASQYLLKFNLVHGDIKLENIMLDDKNHFRLVDFGSIVEIFSTTSRAGTPSYLAPERFQNEAISEQTEIFAIGVVLYKVLTNKFPYGEIEPFQTPKFLKPPKPITHFNKNIPEWLNYLILKMLSKSKDTRYKYYSEVLFDLKNIEQIKPIFNSETPLLERDPLKFYKIGFWILLGMNILQFIF
jgi:serine/threonine protein phosphatase PrpC